jgi:hypothetical protein
VGTGTRSTVVVHNYSDGDNCIAGSNVHFNNGTNNLSNTNIHNGAGSGGLVQIGTGATSTTAVSIATRGASSTNAVRIGNVSNTTYLDSDTIAMGVLGLTGSGAISIATGTNTAGAQVSIGSTSLSALNLKGGQTNLETTTLNLNTNGVGNTLIGTSGGSNSITFNRPLTIGYTSAPSTSQIGGISSVFNATGLPLTTSPFAFISITTNGLPLGNYIGRVYMHINPSAATAKIAFSTSGGSGISIIGANEISYNASGTSADGFNNNLVFFFTVTNATTSSTSYVLYSAVATSTITECNLYAMRIG